MLEDAKRNQLLDMSFLAAIYVASIVVVNPLGNFPLNDDWSYARAVQGLVERGDWRPTSFTGMPLITQSLWGAIFCAVAGFSFNALRLSTLTLAIVGILAVYVLFVTNNRGRLLAVTAALTFGFNPIYYELSTTFMTDVPFATFAILSSIFFIRCIHRFGYFDLLVATALAVAATLCRQLGLFLPLAFAVAIIMQRGFAIRRIPRALLPSVVLAILPSVSCVAALIVFQQWMSMTGRTPALYGITGAVQNLSIKAIGSKATTALLYLGLFCLPTLVLGPSAPRLNTQRKILRILPPVSGALFALVSVYFAFNLLNAWMPISENILITQGLGPLSSGSFERLPSAFWGIVTLLSVVGGGVLVSKIIACLLRVIEKTRMANLDNEDIVRIFCLAAVGAYALPILVAGLFDRYLVPLLPFVLYLSAGEMPREGIGAIAGKSAAAILIALIAVFSVLGTRDYLMWHRVRWEALAELQRIGNVNVHDIDGGFDYNGWFASDIMDKKAIDKIFFNEDARYRFGISVKPGFKIIKEYNYFNWLPPKVRTFFVLERNSLS